MNDEELLTRYYLAQAGSGFGDFYSGPIYQRGCGICSFLGGLFRSILPLLKKTGTAIGQEILKSGSDYIGDLSRNEDPHTSFKLRANETLQKIGKRVLGGGGGYKTRVQKRKPQLNKGRRPVKSKRRKLSKDIFS